MARRRNRAIRCGHYLHTTCVRRRGRVHCCPLVDAVLFVVCAGRTERHAAQQAYQQLTSVGARVLGAVLNDPARRSGAVRRALPTDGGLEDDAGPPPVASRA